MKKIIPLLFLIIILICMLIEADKVINSVSFSFELCFKNLFPSLLPFLILSSILSNYGFVELVSESLKKIMTNLFHLNSNCAYVLVLSILSGTPSNGKYIKELLDNNKITTSDANQILLFSHFVNPIFIIGTIGTIFLGNKIYGIIILISHYLANFIIGIFLRKKEKPHAIKTDFRKVLEFKPKGFIETLKKGINDAISTLLVIFGTITCCLVFSTLISSFFNFNPILNGFLEVTSGLKYISNANIKIIYKIAFSCFFISFGGISIHAQVLSIIDNKKIRYLPYLEARLLQGLISSLIVFFLYMLINTLSVLN